ncbi:MAG: hypothetical protein WCB94_18145, partial [Terriglobales bacterium]
LDYDGTIARDGVLDPDVKAAIVEARAREIVVAIVTGRILSELMGRRIRINRGSLAARVFTIVHAFELGTWGRV